MEQIDVDAVLSQLKDFQRRTVEYAFQRMYLDDDPTRRFLVADEVGLGKTLVARGIIARIIDHLWGKVKRIDIVYICSNANIARQNIQRLNVMADKNFSMPGRITLLPIHMHNLNKNPVNFVSLTPTTSFDLKSRMGIAHERWLLYHLLKDFWHFKEKEAVQVFQGTSGYERFHADILHFPDWYKIDEGLAVAFREAVESYDRAALAGGIQSLTTRFYELQNEFAQLPIDSSLPANVNQARTNLIGDLRRLLADVCVQALQPDLIILDEFQRFKPLLDQEEPIGELAHTLFNYADKDTRARVLLLSATPYKMYTLAADEDQASEDHYSDLSATMKFLFDEDETQVDEFADSIDDYRQEMLRIHGRVQPELLAVKVRLEQCMRSVMSRTERLSVTENRDGMLVHMEALDNRLDIADLRSYLSLQKIARALGHQDTFEYWKSAPYLLSFMEKTNYQLKARLSASFENGAGHEVGKIVANSPEVLLNQENVTRYGAIDPGNARLRSLLASTVGKGLWQLLWLPPALPYYALQEPFSTPYQDGVTKRLIFSNWRVVPKTIATLVSYEAERLIASRFDDSLSNSPEDRRNRSGLLRFTRQDGKPARMSNLALVYPSSTLTQLAGTADPFLYFRAEVEDRQPTLKLDDLLDKVEEGMRRHYLPILRKAVSETEGRVDEAWYWAAPILLDVHYYPTEIRDWFAQPELVRVWAGGEAENGNDADGTAWAQHVADAHRLAKGDHHLGPMPDDLLRVLALSAVSSPANVALRSLSRLTNNELGNTSFQLRNTAGRIGLAFLSLFNLPESSALLRSQEMARMVGDGPASPYWRRTLHYCAAGCLQAVMDEFVHMIRESLGFIDRTNLAKLIEQVGVHIASVLQIRTANPAVDEVDPLSHPSAMSLSTFHMRNRFAMRFGSELGDDGKGEIRAELVRDAFNSPFWPFVLATTSIGQEGLDFHMYCHAVMHWNLPSNPVDLEQREGRVHRYKGHAVRKNVAQAYGNSLGTSSLYEDPWEHLFHEARRYASSDLTPYWTFTGQEGVVPEFQPARIERYVPAQSLSREAAKYNNLKRSLALYRMVFGQPRQEDLLAYLDRDNVIEEPVLVVEQLRINLEPPGT